MYRALADFRTHFQEEVEDTLKVLRAIPDAAATQAIGPKHKNLRQLGWHLAHALSSLPPQIGLNVPSVEDVVPTTLAGVIEAYEKAADALLKALESWTDADLLKEDTLFGYLVWKRGYSLQALEMHQAHHRGQMTVLMRQADLRVPEFYGPTLEVEEAMAAGAK
jgi:uncharacterized damage-inducible protein DinB